MAWAASRSTRAVSWRRVHIPEIDQIIADPSVARKYLRRFDGTGVEIAGLNCNGNPLHPNPVIGEKHAEDVRRTIRAAAALGQTRVVTMSGLPGGEPGTRHPNWIVNAWNSAALDVLDYQWEIAAEFWSGIDQLAKDHGGQGGARTASSKPGLQYP